MKRQHNRKYYRGGNEWPIITRKDSQSQNLLEKSKLKSHQDLILYP